jgi:hypothetical protein
MKHRYYVLDLSADPALIVSDCEDEPIGLLKLLQDVPGVLIFDGRGFLRCQILFSSDNEPVIEIFDAKSGEAISRLLADDESGHE